MRSLSLGQRFIWTGAVAAMLGTLPSSLAQGPPAELASQSAGSGEPLGYQVARRGTATVEDAYRLFLSMAVSQNRVHASIDVSQLAFEEVRTHLEQLCLIDASWTFGPETCLRRDVLAYMSASYLGCRPGLLTGMFGMTRRYAHRDMVYHRIIAAGPPMTLVSGGELLSVITRVERRTQPRRDVQLTDDEIH